MKVYSYYKLLLVIEENDKILVLATFSTRIW